MLCYFDFVNETRDIVDLANCDGATGGRTDRWTERRTEGRTERRREGQTSYRDARTHLKTSELPSSQAIESR